MSQREAHQEYLKALRSLPPEARLRKTFELTAMTRELLLHGLRRRFPEKSEEEIRALAQSRIEKCHNRRS
jgi:hypothetical protein